ncbi:acyl-CoA dehydrogenase family protein [soil metagenome]
MAERNGHQVTERESRAVAEEARQQEWREPSFAKELFSGHFRPDLIHPHPEPDTAEQQKAAEFLERLESFLREKVDAEEIEREGKVPQDVIDGLAELGAFGIKIPGKYGGLGFSQLTYNRAMGLVATVSAALVTLLSAHQSIGVPQPIKLFGTEEQKKKWLPRVAKGAVSAFALTEPEVGSDPARMNTTATPTEDGEAYTIDGEKLWCTNGPIAEVLVVMARTPTEEKPRGITAFVVEADTPGVEIVHRSEFMGLRGIENGVIRFTGVRVPKENVIWGEGLGLKLALTTLNSGRLTIPAAATASGKWCLEVARRWANDRHQWGQPIGKHEAVAQKLADIAATTFAMEAVTELTSLMADAGEVDYRIEAALAKLWNTEAAWRVANEAMQIRGGRGYETAESLKDRGELPVPIERVVRDLRINTIFEGSSEIMRLLIAREAVDEHLRVAGDLISPDLSTKDKLSAFPNIAKHYAAWYPQQWNGFKKPGHEEFGELARHMRFVEHSSRKLARSTFHAMVRFGPKLEKKQMVLFRIVDIGAELFAMSAACVRAQWLLQKNPKDESPVRMVDLFCRMSRRRVDRLFAELFRNDDAHIYKVAREVLNGDYTWVESGIVGPEEGSMAPETHPAKGVSSEAIGV